MIALRWLSTSAGRLLTSVAVLLLAAVVGCTFSLRRVLRADTLLEELGLGDRANNLPRQLSGGEKQRVAIGRALMNEVLVLLDEPTSALDTKLGEQVVGLIRQEMKQRRTAAIIVTHDERITHHADRTAHITDGRIAA